MPSLATRRRRQAAQEGSMDEEGGGSRGTQHVDSEADTQAKLKRRQEEEQMLDVMKQRAHLISFPLFLFGLLALCSHSLHLSFLSCIVIPIALGAALFGVTLLLEKKYGQKEAITLFATHGTHFIFFLLLFTLMGLAISQWFFRDKLGPSLL